MASITTILQLSLGGLLLDQRAFHAQRDAPDGLRRGALLVALVGLMVGTADWIGNLGEYLTQPNPNQLLETIYRGVIQLPLYQELVAENPELGSAFEQSFGQSNGLLASNPLQGLLGLFFAPLIALLVWFIFGSIIHTTARILGGEGTFNQTLACTALASGANLLALVQLIPYAQVAATTILGLIATYLAVRESHHLNSWRSFGAIMLGPVLFALLIGGLFCCVLFLAVNSTVPGVMR